MDGKHNQWIIKIYWKIVDFVDYFPEVMAEFFPIFPGMKVLWFAEIPENLIDMVKGK
jgi:hypothetical protein